MGILTVTFEDQGQDFLEFDIDGQRIVEARPVQSNWYRFNVVTPFKEIKAGSGLVVKSRDTATAPELTIRYPIVSVKPKQQN